MNVPGFQDREKGFEDDYIRRREQEKFAAKKGQQASSSSGTGSLGTQSMQGQGGDKALSNQGTGQAKQMEGSLCKDWNEVKLREVEQRLIEA